MQGREQLLCDAAAEAWATKPTARHGAGHGAGRRAQGVLLSLGGHMRLLCRLTGGTLGFMALSSLIILLYLYRQVHELLRST